MVVDKFEQLTGNEAPFIVTKDYCTKSLRTRKRTVLFSEKEYACFALQ